MQAGERSTQRCWNIHGLHPMLSISMSKIAGSSAVNICAGEWCKPGFVAALLEAFFWKSRGKESRE